MPFVPRSIASRQVLENTFHASFVQANSVKWGEVFLLLDCGGGTTDVGVYEIGHEHPFRLGKEVAKTQGM